ncbi:hypothetical protein N7540_011031 [Penicillium herquei]|nr:hypothetical protein N7540_011031 [Penicillium herquei]
MENLKLELSKSPQLLTADDEFFFTLTPTDAELKKDCFRLFAKESSLTPSELFLTLSSGSYRSRLGILAALTEFIAIKRDTLRSRESEGLTKIVLSLGKEVEVLLPTVSLNPIKTILESVTPAFERGQFSDEWVIELSASAIHQRVRAPLSVLSRFFTEI